jgi:ribosome-associated protein
VERDLAVDHGLVIPGTELVVTASRSSGPGGQHVNKSNTRVTLRWNVVTSAALDDPVRARLLHRLATRLTRTGDLVVHAEASRSRERNLDSARRRMAELVADGLHQRASRRSTRPTRSSRERRLREKSRQSDTKRGRRPVRPGDD